MITFSCPRCQSVLEQPDGAAGTKVACPKCSQRLQVPLPPQNKTILGSWVGPDKGAAASSPAAAFDAQIRLVAGREVVAWYCPLCQNQVEVALDLGQKSIRCPHCAKKIDVPQPGPGGTPPTSGAVPPATPFSTAPASRPENYVQAQPGTLLGLGRDEPGPPPPPRSRRRRDCFYEDEDDDYDHPPRRRPRYSREYSSRAAVSGFICAMCSVGILLLSFVLWVIAVEQGRRRTADPFVVLLLIANIGCFVLGILAVVFSARGLDESNDYNRGFAVAGMVCGIIGLVLGAIFGIFFLFVGMCIWSLRGW